MAHLFDIIDIKAPPKCPIPALEHDFSFFLALRGSLRWLFFLWSLAVVYFVVNGYFLGGYRFSPGETNTALYLLVGALIALVGSWFVMTRRKAR